MAKTRYAGKRTKKTPGKYSDEYLLRVSIVEYAALSRLDALGYSVRQGPAIAFSEPFAKRVDPGYRDVALEGRLRLALAVTELQNPASENTTVWSAFH